MGLFMRPRRPVMRLAAGAATAGVAYRAGQRRVQSNEQAAAAYEATQPATAPAPQPAPAPSDSTAELERLAKLHESGALTDAEFAAAKSRALGI